MNSQSHTQTNAHTHALLVYRYKIENEAHHELDLRIKQGVLKLVLNADGHLEPEIQSIFARAYELVTLVFEEAMASADGGPCDLNAMRSIVRKLQNFYRKLNELQPRYVCFLFIDSPVCI